MSILRWYVANRHLESSSDFEITNKQPQTTYPADERHKVMFAQAKDVDVSHNDHLFVIFGEDRFSDDLCME